MITTFYPPYNLGGDGIFVQRLSNELALRGHEVSVIHCIDSYRLSNPIPAEASQNHPNVSVHGIKSPAGFLSPLATQQTGFPLFKSGKIRKILDSGFDVIHYHNISLVGGPKILECGQGVKLCTMHDYWFVCPTHVLFRFNRAPCTARHCFLCGLTYKRPPQWWRRLGLMKDAVSHVDAFIVPSRFSEEMHRRTGFTAPITVLPNFVPPPTDLASQGDSTAGVTRTLAQPPYFLFVGRLEKLKGAQTLIPVFRRYRKAQLWIAGTGSYASHLQHLSERDDNIKFLGHTAGTDLAALYGGAVAVIAPSLCLETFSQVIVEAFSQQTPAVVRNLGAMPEIIQQSGGGLIYNSDDELIASLENLRSNPPLRKSLGLLGYQAYRQRWTGKVHLDSYLALIARIKETREPVGERKRI